MCAVRSDNTPHCTCQEGYDHDPDYGCVDESPPILTLRPDPTHPFDPNTGITHLSQGDRYEEYGVDVVDDNAEIVKGDSPRMAQGGDDIWVGAVNVQG